MSRIPAVHLKMPSGVNQTGTVIFFHGSGGTGDLMKQWVDLMVKNFSFSQIKIIYPTAPLQPYTPAAGEMRNVWFDRIDINQKVPENLSSLAQIETEVKNLINTEVSSGIPVNRIIVGGFSMGGALALHTAYRWEPNLAAAFAFSSFLNDNSIVYKQLKDSEGKVPPLLHIHGNSDDLVDLSWGKTTFEHLKTLGVQGEFHTIHRLGHSINRTGLNLIYSWIQKHLPEI
ncbi:unnamed protein product [Pieris macdunnoughi]|uniref:palmitoyl-protein hydrolase n=1 Tax=Pieris macdunnoughi TaxID=345717 RepID=A0A821L6N2_9NEOP|nr:unnamed protein product [Pieris macdunnoughi]